MFKLQPQTKTAPIFRAVFLIFKNKFHKKKALLVYYPNKAFSLIIITKQLYSRVTTFHTSGSDTN